MRIILVSKHHGRTRSFSVNGWIKALVCACLLIVPVTIGVWLGYQVSQGDGSDLFTADSTRTWSRTLKVQKEQIEYTRRNAEEQLSALTLRMAELQARLLRLDALGERLTTLAKLDTGEFDFSQPPPIGGPESAALGDAYSAPEFLSVIYGLVEQIEDREQQLDTLEAMLAKRKIQDDVFIAGRPVTKGWVSSRFGRRTDPFNGHVAWHSGVDFAGKVGTEIISVASGVVTWSGEKPGYGLMVEVNHGSGFATGYAHNSANLVKVGDIVKKGQAIARIGSSGRSTGPHVHFEVYKDGSPVDPSAYIHRASR